MRFGTGIDRRLSLAAAVSTALALLVLAAPLGDAAAAPEAGGTPATTTSIEPLAATTGGAATAQTASLFVLTGSTAPTRLHAFTAPDTGRLTLTSPEGIAAPSSAAAICKQDNPTQVSCNPGAVVAIVGDLQAGADAVTTDPALTVAIGIRIAGPDRPLIGGGGRDRLRGGEANDLIEGGTGPDSIHGNGGTDILRGGAGDDSVNGGGSPDALYGGGGADRLNGAPGRDLCVGGPAKDHGRSCDVSKTIP